MTVVITPVGTSLFTNAREDNTTIRDLFSDIEDLRASEWDSYEDHINDLKDFCKDFINDSGDRASAELESSGKIQDALGTDITVHLITTDTIASRLAAEILQENAASVLSPQVSVIFDEGQDLIRDLQAVDPNAFSERGTTNLFRRLYSIRDGFQDDQLFAVNITPGYAATVALLTIFAQLNRFPIYYSFEGAAVTITIPQLR